MEESFITIKSKKERLDAFSRLLDDTTLALKEKAKQTVNFYKNYTGESLEDVVLENMRCFADRYSFNKQDFKKAQKQHFPDIITGDFFGVEVKSTIKDSWQSVGSSIVESLRAEEIEKVFLMFGKLCPNNVDFRCKPYEECLYDISVTHSPRYQIDMDLKIEQTIFSKMGVDYDVFRNDPDQIQIVRNYYRNKYRESNSEKMPWWIGDEKEFPHLPKALEHNMGVLRLSTDLDKHTIDYLKACVFILFPEVLGNNKTKYNRASLWLCSRHSIINPRFRDSFSASGQISIYVDGKLKWKKCPHIIGTFLELLETIRNIFPELNDDIFYYSDYVIDKNDLFKSWETAADNYLQESVPNNMIRMKHLLQLDLVGVSGRGLVYNTKIRE